MYRYEKLLVCLDLTEKDDAVLAHSAFVSALAQSKSVVFLHCLGPEEVPDVIREKYGVESVKDSAASRIGNLVQKYFLPENPVETAIKVVKGSPLEEALICARKEDIDLIICGKSNKKKIHDVLPIRIVRKSPCSVMFIPEGYPNKLKKILVPIDRSDYSAMATDVASAFGTAGNVQNLHFLHVCYFPDGYRHTKFTKEELLIDLQIYTKERVDEFVSELNLRGLSFETVIKVDVDTDTAILSHARENEFDLIVMGCKGKRAVVAALLGSSAQRVAKNTDKPLVIVKKKGENAGLLNFLLDDD